MSPGTSTGWPTERYSSGRSSSPGPNALVAPLAVDQYLPARVLLELGVVVRQVVEEPQTFSFGVEPGGGEGLPA